MLRHILGIPHGAWCFLGWHHPAQLLLLRHLVAERGGVERALPFRSDGRCDPTPLLAPADARALLIRTDPALIDRGQAWSYLRIVNGYRDRVLDDWRCPLLWTMPAEALGRAPDLAPDTWSGRGLAFCMPEANADIDALLATLDEPPDPLRDEPGAMFSQLATLVRSSIGTARGPAFTRAWAALGGPIWAETQPAQGAAIPCVVSERLFSARGPYPGQLHLIEVLDLAQAAAPGQDRAELAALEERHPRPLPQVVFYVPRPHARERELELTAMVLAALAAVQLSAVARVEPLPLRAGEPVPTRMDGVDVLNLDSTAVRPDMGSPLVESVEQAIPLLNAAGSGLRLRVRGRASAMLRLGLVLGDRPEHAAGLQLSAVGERATLWGPSGLGALNARRDPYFFSYISERVPVASADVALVVSVDEDLREPAARALPDDTPHCHLTAPNPGRGAIQPEDACVALAQVERAIIELQRRAPAARLHVFASAPSPLLVRMGLLLARLWRRSRLVLYDLDGDGHAVGTLFDPVLP